MSAGLAAGVTTIYRLRLSGFYRQPQSDTVASLFCSNSAGHATARKGGMPKNPAVTMTGGDMIADSQEKSINNVETLNNVRALL